MGETTRIEWQHRGECPTNLARYYGGCYPANFPCKLAHDDPVGVLDRKVYKFWLALEECSKEIWRMVDKQSLKDRFGDYGKAMAWLWNNRKTRAIFDKYGVSVDTTARRKFPPRRWERRVAPQERAP